MSTDLSSQITIVTNIALVIVASIGIFIAWYQLRYLARQMHETRLAGSMSGLLTLYNEYQELGALREEIRKALPDDWNQWECQKQVAHIRSQQIIVSGKKRSLEHACIDVANLYEMIGALVNTDALPREMAFKTFGGSSIYWWKRLRAWVEASRKQRDDHLMFNNFELIASSFNKQIKSPPPPSPRQSPDRS